MIKIAISSGKGGTGKTFVATNLSWYLSEAYNVTYLDCDVEEPNGHIFLKPVIEKEIDVKILSPAYVEEEKCVGCKKCVEACQYNAICVVKDKVLIFKEMCNGCGACRLVCPVDAIVEKERKIGIVKLGKAGRLNFCYGVLEILEGRMTPPLIREVKKNVKEEINILDSPPGTGCPVVETVKDVDMCIFVTDPTPFGINDLKLAVSMARRLGKIPLILINRVDPSGKDLSKFLENWCKEQGLEVIGKIPDDIKIAKAYSRGDLIIEVFDEYRKIFADIASKILEKTKERWQTIQVEEEQDIGDSKSIDVAPSTFKPKELVVISGKGGTGKTSLTACFSVLGNKEVVISDCDVDASDLHLVLSAKLEEKGYFKGRDIFVIDQNKCQLCGVCKNVCRFGAIEEVEKEGKKMLIINEHTCQGCGACVFVCKYNAIKPKEDICGEWFISSTRAGKMSHARLFPGKEASGRLVTLVRENEKRIAKKDKIDKALIDGSPGLGCPVVSSIVGTQFVLVVAEPTLSGVHDMERVLMLVRHFNIPCGVVVNKFDLNSEITSKIKDVCENYNVKLIGLIPYDKKFTEAQIKGVSFVEYVDCDTTNIIKDIWNRIKEYLR